MPSEPGITTTASKGWFNTIHGVSEMNLMQKRDPELSSIWIIGQSVSSLGFLQRLPRRVAWTLQLASETWWHLTAIGAIGLQGSLAPRTISRYRCDTIPYHTIPYPPVPVPVPKYRTRTHSHAITLHDVASHYIALHHILTSMHASRQTDRETWHASSDVTHKHNQSIINPLLIL